MRYIRKRREEPRALAEFKAAANADWTPTYDKLTRAEKQEIQRSLLEEQGYICCYCGGRIGQREDDCHIEHFLTQHDRDDLALYSPQPTQAASSPAPPEGA